MSGQIVFLNGASSSGKSSIARHLLEILERPWFHMAVDDFNAMRAETRTGQLTSEGLDEALTRTRAGFHRAVAGMAAAGNDVVVDHLLSEEWRLRDCLEVLAGFDVVFVGVRCSVAELNRRELARGDRIPGQALAHVVQVHAHGDYDLECDTTATPPRESAERIAEFLRNRPAGPSAFDRLRVSGAAGSGRTRPDRERPSGP